jgi:hypothetical protein
LLDFFALSARVSPVNKLDADNEREDINAAPSARPSTVTWRIILLFIVLALLRGAIYAAIIPPWESPDEYGHFEYAWLVSQYGPLVGPEAIPSDFQQRMLEITAQHDYWRQVGDDPPLYYALVGSALRLAGNQDLATGMYIGRIVSVTLYAAAVGLAALTTRRLFPQSLFMQITPPAFVLFLPMLGEMGAAINNDVMGVLSGTLFFASLLPILRDGLSWRRGGAVLAALFLALLSRKTALFLLPTAVVALPIYAWTRGLHLSRQVKLVLAAGTALLVLTGAVLALIPGDDAAGWAEWTGSCGATRVERDSLEGKAALRIGACADEVIAQTLPPETAKRLAGQRVKLMGWARTIAGQAVGQVSVWDSEEHSYITITAKEEWQPFTLTHAVDSNARWVGVRLTWGGSGEALLFDSLTLSSGGEENLLTNGSAERRETLLIDLLNDTTRHVGAPRSLVQRVLRPESWSLEAWQEYERSAIFCFHSFWGNFGWLALPLPTTWYWAIELACMLAMVGNLTFLISRPGHRWQTGYLFTLMNGVLLLILQTLLPIVANRGTYWLPQGRYLFPGTFAIAVLLSWGAYQLLPGAWKSRMIPAAVGLMAGFDLACLVLLIIPYFYAPG